MSASLQWLPAAQATLLTALVSAKTSTNLPDRQGFKKAAFSIASPFGAANHTRSTHAFPVSYRAQHLVYGITSFARVHLKGCSLRSIRVNGDGRRRNFPTVVAWFGNDAFFGKNRLTGKVLLMFEGVPAPGLLPHCPKENLRSSLCVRNQGFVKRRGLRATRPLTSYIVSNAWESVAWLVSSSRFSRRQADLSSLRS